MSEPELPPLPQADGMLENGYLYVILSKVGQHGRACFYAGRAPLLAEIERLKKDHRRAGELYERERSIAEKAERELEKFRIAEKQLSDAYIRLRDRIPGAFNTPRGPTPEQVWTHTEKCLDELRAQLEAAQKYVERHRGFLKQILSKQIKQDSILCGHPSACEREPDGYCGRCHSEMYP